MFCSHNCIPICINHARVSSFTRTTVYLLLMFLTSFAEEMASGVPSFIKQFVKYEDICSDEEEAGPIQATPISRVPPVTASIQENLPTPPRGSSPACQPILHRPQAPISPKNSGPLHPMVQLAHLRSSNNFQL